MRFFFFFAVAILLRPKTFSICLGTLRECNIYKTTKIKPNLLVQIKQWARSEEENRGSSRENIYLF